VYRERTDEKGKANSDFPNWAPVKVEIWDSRGDNQSLREIKEEAAEEGRLEGKVANQNRSRFARREAYLNAVHFER